MRNSRSDASEIWDEAAEGVVTDVVKTKNRVKVSVRSIKPSKVVAYPISDYGRRIITKKSKFAIRRRKRDATSFRLNND